MNGQDDTKIIEPLAKFHVPVISKFRVVIPDGEKVLFKLDKGTYVELIIRKIDPSSLEPLKRVHAIVKLTSRGMFTLAKPLRQELNIEIGDILEILLVDSYTIEELIREEYKHLLQFTDTGFEVIDEIQEREIITSRKKKLVD